MKLILSILLRACKVIIYIAPGKKIFAGAIITGLGVVCLFFPSVSSWAKEFFIIGIPILVGGSGQKMYRVLTCNS